MIGLRVDDDLHLALPVDAHAAPLFALVDAERDRIGEWIDVSGLRDVDAQRAALAAARQGFGAGRRLPFVIEVGPEAGGEVAGTVDLFVDAGRSHIGELGYLLGQRFEGRGIVTRCVAAVIDEAFGRMGLRRLEIRAAPGNERSLAVPRRLGFREEGVTRGSANLDGRDVDEVMFALLTSDPRPTLVPRRTA